MGQAKDAGQWDEMQFSDDFFIGWSGTAGQWDRIRYSNNLSVICYICEIMHFSNTFLSYRRTK